MMRIISRKTLRRFWERHPNAESALRNWYKTTRQAAWSNFAELRQTFGSADQVRVCHGNTVVVFDVGGNKYRLIAAVHYNRGVVYALLVLTHKDYDKGKWKEQLC
jgi:mRNA interferase HigB